MTGYCVRIERDGSWQSIDIDQLTDTKLDALALVKPDAGWAWAKALARWIRQNVRQVEIDDIVKRGTTRGSD